MNDDTCHKEDPLESLIGSIISVIFWGFFLLFLGWVIIGICRLLWNGVTSIWKYIFIPIVILCGKGFIESYTFIINSERKLLRLNGLEN